MRLAHYCSCVALAVAAGNLPGEKAAAEPVGEPTDLLGGRLTIEVPKGGFLEGRGHPLMGAATPGDEETRIVLDRETERLVLLATETFQTAAPRFDERVVAPALELSPNEIKVEPFPVSADDVRVYRATPVKITSDRDANLVAVYFVVPAGGTVAMLAFHVNPDAAGNARYHARLAERIARTVRSGNSRLATAAGTRRLGRGLAVNVPDGYVVRVQPGPDFVVYRIQRITSFGGPLALMGLYLGGYPSPGAAGAKIRGKLFGSDVEWSLSTEGAGGRKVLETVQPAPGGDEKAHVWLVADDDALLSEVRSIAESLAVASQGPATEPVDPIRTAIPSRPARRTRWIKLAQPDHNAAGIALDATHVYFGDMGGTVYRVSKTGGAAVVLGKSDGWASTLAVDDTHLYWTGTFSDGIHRVPKSGGDPVEIAKHPPACKEDASCMKSVDRIALVGESVYWANRDTVWRVAKTGGTPAMVVGGQPGAERLQSDGDNLYWINAGSGEIKKLPIHEREPTTLISTHDQRAIYAIAGGSAWLIFRKGPDKGSILRVPLAGSPTAVVGNAPSGDGFMGIAADAQNVFWTTQSPPSVRRIPVGGGKVSTVALDQPDPYQIVVDASGVYWTNQHGDQGVMKLPK